MKKKLLAGLAGGMMLAGLTGGAQATLLTIGTAGYNGNDYNLIWDDDNNGKSLVWLDYSAGRNSLQTQIDWAAGLNNSGVLAYTLNSGYSLDFDTVTWRLPEVTDPDHYFTFGYDGTTSEMDHLYFTEFGLTYTGHPYTSAELAELTVFDHLLDGGVGTYWTSTFYDEFPAWGQYFTFSLSLGIYSRDEPIRSYSALAVTEANVSVVGVTPTPEPATMLLFGTGLAGLAGSRLRRKRKA